MDKGLCVLSALDFEAIRRNRQEVEEHSRQLCWQASSANHGNVYRLLPRGILAWPRLEVHCIWYLEWHLYHSWHLLGEQYTRLATKLGFDQQSMGWRTFQIVRTFIICSFGRFFSRGESLEAAFGMINRFFHGWCDITWLFDGTLTSLGLERPDWLVLACAIAVLFWIDSLHERGISIRNTIDEQHVVFRWFVYCIAFLAVVIFGVWGSSYDASAFIYGKL